MITFEFFKAFEKKISKPNPWPRQELTNRDPLARNFTVDFPRPSHIVISKGRPSDNGVKK
jgi:hypothetical protein